MVIDGDGHWDTWRAGLNTPYTWIYYAWNVYYTPARNTSSCNAHNRWLYACTDMHTNTYIYKYIQTYVQTCTRVCVSLCLFVIEAKVAATADTAFFLLSCHFTWQTDKKMRRTFQCTKGVSDSCCCCCFCFWNWELSAMPFHSIRLPELMLLLTFLSQLCLLATINIHSVFAVLILGFCCW